MGSDRPKTSGVACLVVALLAFTSASCSGPEPPTTAETIHLADGYEPRFAEERRVVREGEGWTMSFCRRGTSAWLETEYRPEAWHATPKSGAYFAHRPVPRPMERGAITLNETFEFEHVHAAADTRRRIPCARISEAEARADLDAVAPHSWGTSADVLVMFDDDGAPPPEKSIHRVDFELGRLDGERWRVSGARFTGDGFLVLPGEGVDRTVGAGSGRTLSFVAVAQGVFALSDGTTTQRCRVTFDGDEIWSDEMTFGELGARVDVEVPLPDSETASTLRFEFEGPFGVTGILDPVVGPGSAARARDPRPDVVILVADTFRADNLGAYRGLPGSTIEGLAPNLDAFAASGRVHLRSWSSSTWTLPSHSSMFTSLTPIEHTAVETFRRMPEGIATLAEVARDAGYRTEAVTESGYVSASFAVDRGFELFDEWSPRGPVALDRLRAVLRRRDGRPVLLFLHTYFAHTPYRPDAASIERVGGDPNGANFDDLLERLGPLVDTDPSGWTAEQRDEIAAVGDLYRAQVGELDVELGALFDTARAADLWDDAYWIFTSDHGESFGEHGKLLHSFEPFEHETRVPFVLRGPGVEPGLSDEGVSSVDLAPTVCEIIGASAPPAWRGRSLLSPSPEAPIWSQQVFDENIVTAGHVGSLKAFFDAQGERGPVFDLATDVAELSPLGDAELRAAEDALRELGAGIGGALTERLRRREFDRSSETLREVMEMLGYRVER
ncbi:MAG: sulfatase [Planctomycetota bacterium]